MDGEGGRVIGEEDGWGRGGWVGRRVDGEESGWGRGGWMVRRRSYSEGVTSLPLPLIPAHQLTLQDPQTSHGVPVGGGVGGEEEH